MTTSASACPRCGTIVKSGTSSCCGRGGAWFKTCGRASNTKHQRTWYEGIQACEARPQSNSAVGQQGNAAELKGMDSSQGFDMANDKAAVAVTKMFAFMLVNASTPMPVNVPIGTTPALSLMPNIFTTPMAYSTRAPANKVRSAQGRSCVWAMSLYTLSIVSLSM